MKDRFHGLVRTQVALAAIIAAIAFAGAGCSGSNSAGGSSQDTGGSAAAVGGSSAGGRHRMAAVLMGLGLSDAQKSQIRDIMRAARKQGAGADPATRRANFQAALAKIDTVLTPVQRTKLHEKLDRMRSEGQPSSSPQPS